ncbi:MAG: RNase adapter RapZ [Nitrospirota bacterium]|nr:RNase adapter RapZ [Nitrospirota bacterium]
MSPQASGAGEGTIAVTHPPIHFVVLTGTSGSGKSHALNFLEDAGYFCVDNLPLTLIPPFAELFSQPHHQVDKIALVVDVRERFFLEAGTEPIARLRSMGHRVETVFMDADDAVLIRRYSETRRPHPLSPDGGVIEGILKERDLLAPLRNTAERRIDTSTWSIHDLRNYIQSHYGRQSSAKTLTISLVAFGFKYGIPLEADLLFDVRFLSNPHFVPELTAHTGEHPAVRDHVLADPRTGPLLERLEGLLAFSIPEYAREGRSYLTVGIGCTGGKHRSVVMAGELAQRLRQAGHVVELRLRDAPKAKAQQEADTI